MEVIDLGLNDTEPITLRMDENTPSMNFGPGLELLMNDKMKTTNFGSGAIDLGELEQMESELNTLSGRAAALVDEPPAPSTSKSFFGNWFGGGGSGSNTQDSGAAPSTGASNLGEATASTFSGVTKSNDGYGKINTEVPIEAPSRMTERDRRRKKRLMLKKLEEWYEKGLLKNNSGFNMDSNYEEIEDEYESALEDKRQKDAIKVQGWWFMSLVNSIEYGNAYFDPFGLNLDGWGEQVSEDLDSYEEIFGELYQKYKGGKLAPELALLLRLGFSAAVVNFTNKALSSATPGFNDVIKQSPELMKMFTNATVQSMSQASPGFGMASELLQQQPKVGGREPEPNMNFGPPPLAVATKNQPPPQRHPLSNMQFTRPDIMAARGEGVDLQQSTPINMDQSTMMRGPPGPRPEMRGPSAGPRPEMRGPQNMDLDNILSNLKVKVPEPPRPTASSFFGGSTQVQNTMEAALAPPPPQPQEQAPIQFKIQEPTQESMADASEMESVNTSIYNENDSMISISSMREMQNVNVPKRAGRKKRQTNQATISLDI
jgi:Family of unknown function (DUF5767)